jgi:predicted PurR-regulated permease PerM
MPIALVVPMFGIEGKAKRPHVREATQPAPQRAKLTTMCLVFLSFVVGVFALRYAQAILLPVVLSLLIFYTLDPVVRWIAALGIPRVIACAVLLLTILGAGVAGVYFLRGQAEEMLEQLPAAITKARAAIESGRKGPPGTVAKVQDVQEAAGELQKSASEAAGTQPPKGVTRVQIEEPLFRASDYLWSGSVGLLWFSGQALTVFCLVFFLLAWGDSYKRRLIGVGGSGVAHQRRVVGILKEIDQQIGRFLLIQVLTSATVGAAMGISLWLLGVNQAAMWGVAAGILNAIPYFGPIVVTGALTLVAFLQFGTLEMVGIVAGVTMLVTSLDWYVLTPMLTGRLSNMNNLAAFLSVLFWGWLWGALGMLLAVPIMMAIKSICDHVDELKPIGNLLGEENDA